MVGAAEASDHGKKRVGGGWRVRNDEIGIPAVPVDSPCLQRLLDDLTTLSLAHAERPTARERLAVALGEEFSRRLLAALVEERRPSAKRVVPPHAA